MCAVLRRCRVIGLQSWQVTACLRYPRRLAAWCFLLANRIHAAGTCLGCCLELERRRNQPVMPKALEVSPQGRRERVHALKCRTTFRNKALAESILVQELVHALVQSLHEIERDGQ